MSGLHPSEENNEDVLDNEGQVISACWAFESWGTIFKNDVSGSC